MEMFLLNCFFTVLCIFFILCFFWYLSEKDKKGKENDFISINEAIDRILYEVPESEVVEIIRCLPDEYHYQYWLNFFNKEFLFKTYKFCGFDLFPNMKELNKRLKSIEWFSIKVKDLDKIIKKLKKEEEEKKLRWERAFPMDKKCDNDDISNKDIVEPNDYGSNKDDGKTVDLDKIVNDISEENKK